VGTLSPIDHSSGDITLIIDAVLYTVHEKNGRTLIITLGNVAVPEDALLIYIINIYTAGIRFLVFNV
jgi:hypothetical protein